MSLLIGTLMAIGLVLLSPDPMKRLRLALVAGVFVLFWRLLWQGSANAVVAKLPLSLARGPVVEGLLTLLVAGGAMVPLVLGIILSRAWFGAVRPSAGAVLLVPAWTAGFILPALGRGGSWPLISEALAAAVIVLSLLLGLLLASVGPLAGQEKQ